MGRYPGPRYRRHDRRVADHGRRGHRHALHGNGRDAGDPRIHAKHGRQHRGVLPVPAGARDQPVHVRAHPDDRSVAHRGRDPRGRGATAADGDRVRPPPAGGRPGRDGGHPRRATRRGGAPGPGTASNPERLHSGRVHPARRQRTAQVTQARAASAPPPTRGQREPARLTGAEEGRGSRGWESSGTAVAAPGWRPSSSR